MSICGSDECCHLAAEIIANFAASHDQVYEVDHLKIAAPSDAVGLDAFQAIVTHERVE
jgi:hypothetical protein